MLMANYKEQIAKSGELLRAFRKDKGLFNKEKDILELCKQRYQMCWSQIHEVLVPKKTDAGEKEIRDIIKGIFALDLPVCEAKIDRFKRAIEAYEKRKDADNVELCYQYLQEWLMLYENNYALVAFRSFEHFGLFMEWDSKEKDRVWQPSLDPYNDGGYTGVSKPFFYFFNQMVLQKNIRFISKQMFTGGGKSRSNQFAFAWLLGIDSDNDILDVLGNPTLVLTNAKGTMELMISKRFAQVFPRFQKYHEMDGDIKGNMFSVCRLKEGELTLADSNKPLNLKVISKQTSVDGIRVRYLFLDDVCRSCDANNLKQHEIDIGNFWNSWWKRNYGTDDFYVVVSGTAYSVFDILSHLISYYSGGKMYRTAQNKYTYANEKGDCIFIKIPKIDFDFDRSTYPQKFPYEEAIKIRERDEASFEAMEQQNPQNPATSPLCYEKIRTYETLPEGLSDFSYALLDPARSGKNFVSMGIHRVRKEIDKFNTEIECHYLTDCVFQLKLMEELYDEICDKIEQHHIIRLHIENNTDTSLAFLIEKMLHEREIYFCVISESFSSENKEEKIREMVYNSEGYFKRVMVYPAMKLYAPSSQMGKFMMFFTAYDYEKPPAYDDSIDEECMYIDTFVKKTKKSNKPKIIQM